MDLRNIRKDIKIGCVIFIFLMLYNILFSIIKVTVLYASKN